MVKFRSLILLIFFTNTVSMICAQAQDHQTYIVYFTDKDTSGFNPYDFFDAKAISRRVKKGLSLGSFNDIPVNDEYLLKMNEAGCEVLVASRWLNAAFIRTNQIAATDLASLPFVKRVDLYAYSQKYIAAAHESEAEKPLHTNKLLQYQVARFGSDVFKEKKLNGKGVRIAVFDVGFNGVDKHEAFEHMRKNNQVKATYDFIKKAENVYHGGSHGTMTLSCIGGKMPGADIGMATGAEFLLARTEMALREKIAEEYFWLAAAEWADKNGADIISSSLGYGESWYKVEDMNGRKSIVSFAATTAAQKGILVVNSAGNEFQSKWKMIITPADADSVLCVGGTDPNTDRHIRFSSSGPSSDFRIKPNVSAPGYVFAANPKKYSNVNGTSFSCPLVAGFAACAWQNDTSLTNMQLFKAIEQSGHLYPYFDYMHGYGVPQASNIINRKKREPGVLFKVDFDDVKNGNIEVVITDTDLLEKIKSLGKKQLNLYWNVQSQNGRLKQYEVLGISSSSPAKIMLSSNKIEADDIINIHFEGYSFSKKQTQK